MRIRILHFILFSCLVIGCTNKSSKKGMVNFDSIQKVKPIAETIHVNYETLATIKICASSRRGKNRYLSNSNRYTAQSFTERNKRV